MENVFFFFLFSYLCCKYVPISSNQFDPVRLLNARKHPHVVKVKGEKKIHIILALVEYKKKRGKKKESTILFCSDIVKFYFAAKCTSACTAEARQMMWRLGTFKFILRFIFFGDTFFVTCFFFCPIVVQHCLHTTT